MAGARLRHYELIREIGRGGMGQVFLARDTKLGRRVAVKVLAASTSAEHLQRFLMEARTTAQCTHENIVVIHEADEHLGQPYLVLEYLEGVTLRDHLGQRRLPFGRAVELMVPVVRALVRAHEGQIVHRDLKPENVFVTHSGTVKVLDFGLAKASTASLLDGAGRPDGITGTPPYMAPEQFWEPHVDERADLYAVGVMFFEMLTGRHPVQPLTVHTLMASAALVEEPLPSLGKVMEDLPRRLEMVVDRCLRKRREDRYPSARALLDDLLPLLPQRHGRQLDRDESPFPGLAAFRESDADRFFGRSGDVRRMLALLDRQPLVAIAGPSGVGKSSVVRAGLVPALKAVGEPWEVLFVRPGRSPLGSLAAVLLRWESGRDVVTDERGRADLVQQLRREPGSFGAAMRERAAERGTKILLVLDQFEELFTQADPAERAAFTASITGAADDGAGPIRILLSMRSDFLDRLGEDPRLLDEATRGLQFLAPLAKDGLREALTQPILLRGHGFEDERMVDELVDTLATTPGALPLMQFVAGRLWESRDAVRKVLTRQAFTEMGGVAGALAAHAEEVVLALGPAAVRSLRVVLPRLVTPEGTRRVVDLEELDGLAGDGQGARALVEDLVRARLLVMRERSDGPAAVELVHESLIVGWPTLRRVIEEGREDAAFVAQLRAAAKQWAERGRKAGLLWQGETADEARQWHGRNHAELSEREQAFLDAVLAQAARVGRVRRIVIGAGLGLLFLTLAVGAVALVFVRRAERAAVAEAERAQHETVRARAAEQKIKDQLAVIAAEQSAKVAALGQVARGKEDLRDTNDQLKLALARAEEESRRAREAATRAGELAESIRKTNAELQKNYAREKARNDELSRERKKISTDLR